MANFSLPTVTSVYTDVLNNLNDKINALAVGMTGSHTSIPTDTIRWGTNKWQKWDGSTWTDLATTYSISISGNANTVTNGVYTTGNQSIAGDKAFTGNCSFSNTLAASINGNANTVTNGAYLNSIQTFTQLNTFNNLRVASNTWITDGAGAARIHFVSSAATIIQGASSAGVHLDVRNLTGTQMVVVQASGGDMYVRGNITAYWSDWRLKQDIQPLTNCLNKICSLEPVEYSWNRKGRKLNSAKRGAREPGFIAQKVREVIPAAVTGNELALDENGEAYLTLKDNKIIPYLVGSIKELMAEIESLKLQLKELKE